MKRFRYISVFMLCIALLCGCKDKTEETSEASVSEDTSVTTAEPDITPVHTGTIREDQTSQTSENVNDTTAPVILSASSYVKLDVGDIFDANNYISYIDDYDRVPVLSLDGPVDTTVAGTYETTLVITDNAGNVTRKSLTVKVRGDEPSDPTPTPSGPTNTPTPTPVPENLPFDEFKSRYESVPGVEFGIDVSKWQGDVDYEQVKAAGCSFVIIRAGSYYQGEFNIDVKFEQNLTNAKAAGLKVGLYFYTPVTSEEILLENVDKICDALNGRQLDLPIAYDMETWSRFQQYKINLQDLNGLFYSFCDRLESRGYSGMLYNSKNKLETVLDSGGHPVWLAHYTRETTYEGDYILWQVSNVGRISGINGDVDLDLFYPDRYNNG